MNFVLCGRTLTYETYEVINIYQWVQGFSRCIMEESDSNTRTQMLQNQANLVQDAIVHTEIERACVMGRSNQSGPDATMFHPEGSKGSNEQQ